MKVLTGLLLAACTVSLTGCGDGSKNCSAVAINVTPTTGNADHSAASPGNKVQFFAIQVVPTGCVAIASALNGTSGLTWSVSDAAKAAISNTPATVDGTNGTATCLGTSSTPITVTATYIEPSTKTPLTATATMACQ